MPAWLLLVAFLFLFSSLKHTGILANFITIPECKHKSLYENDNKGNILFIMIFCGAQTNIQGCLT